MKFTSHLMLSLACAHSAWASISYAQPSDVSVRQFVKSYRVDQAVSLIAMDAIYDAATKEGPNKPYFQCVTSNLRPENFRETAETVVRENFSSTQTLEELNTFFESATGSKLSQLVVDALAKRPIRRTKGEPLAQPSDFQLSPREQTEFKTLLESPANDEFQRFRKAMNNVGKHPAMGPPLDRIKEKCLSEIRNKTPNAPTKEEP